jgi:PAS domain S-box-containing protein
MTECSTVWPIGGGEMGERIRSLDWAATPLGRIGTWPQSLRTLVELMLSSQQPVYIGWGDELVSLFNDGYIAILGPKFPAALGTPYFDVWPEISPELRSLVTATLDGQAQYSMDHPLTLAGREGEPLSWFSFSWTPIRDDHSRVAGFYCAALETTEKIQAEAALLESREEALRVSEDRYRTLFDAMDEGFCILELMFDSSERAYDYRFLEANQAFERHSGMAGALGRTMREFAPDHEEWWFETYGRVALTGQPTRFENFAARLGERWFDVYAFRVGDPRDRHVAVLFNDISARKRAENALQEANRRKDEFLATLAHELRNPLAPLRTGLEVARLKAPADEGLRPVLDRMDRQLSHVVRLVDDLLDVGRISSGKLQLQKVPLELGAILASSIESTLDLIRKRGHELVVDSKEQGLLVHGDFDRLTQVFNNLLSNAAKYTPAGGKIGVVLDREGPHAVVRVGDSGIGIPATELAHVFDLFSQVREHQGLTSGGLGIGLALVKTLVSMHAGEVVAHSAGPGQGSTFTVRLPIHEPHGAVIHADAAPAPQAGYRRRRILIADDNLDGATTLAELFELLGHEVWTAEDGLEAVERARALSPDIVVLDLGMPRMDGYEAARQIRATPAGRDALLVALTGWGQDKDRLRTREAGFHRHLVKPVDQAALVALLAGGREEADGR